MTTKDTQKPAAPRSVRPVQPPLYQKDVVCDRETHDYALYLDGELVGFARTYDEAVKQLDDLVFTLLSGQYLRSNR